MLPIILEFIRLYCFVVSAPKQRVLFKVLWEDTVTFVLYQMIIFPLTSVSHNNAENRIIRSFLIKHVGGDGLCLLVLVEAELIEKL